MFSLATSEQTDEIVLEGLELLFDVLVERGEVGRTHQVIRHALRGWELLGEPERAVAFEERVRRLPVFTGPRES